MDRQLIDRAVTGEDPSADVWSGETESDHAQLVVAVRELVATRRLGAPASRAALVHLMAEWGLALASAVIGLVADRLAVWIVVWFVMAWVLAGNAALNHEAVHGHLFRSKAANRVVGVAALAPLFGSFATFRAYHWQHHALTARPGDPEGTPLSFRSRFLYAAVLLVGGIAVLVENLVYTIITVAGHPPTWARASRHRRAIRWNALLVAATVVLAVVGMYFDPAVTLEVWLVPAGIATVVLLPLLLLPEHYGATGEGDIVSNTRSIQSNRLLRWFYWNTNYHAAHHVAPSVSFNRIEEIDDALLEQARLDPNGGFVRI